MINISPASTQVLESEDLIPLILQHLSIKDIAHLSIANKRINTLTKDILADAHDFQKLNSKKLFFLKKAGVITPNQTEQIKSLPKNLHEIPFLARDRRTKQDLSLLFKQIIFKDIDSSQYASTVNNLTSIQKQSLRLITQDYLDGTFKFCMGQVPLEEAQAQYPEANFPWNIKSN